MKLIVFSLCSASHKEHAIQSGLHRKIDHLSTYGIILGIRLLLLRSHLQQLTKLMADMQLLTNYLFRQKPVTSCLKLLLKLVLTLSVGQSLQYGDDDYDNMGDDDYDDYSKELNQYKKSKDRGRGLYVFSFSSCFINSTFFHIKD